jgi:hypothetical protein
LEGGGRNLGWRGRALTTKDTRDTKGIKGKQLIDGGEKKTKTKEQMLIRTLYE